MSTAAPKQKTLILIVDDDPRMRQTLRECLHGFGYDDVLEAADGAQAAEQVAVAHPDLVFLDLKMPHMNGLEALRTIRLLDPRLPVIIVSAYPTFEGADRAFEMGATEFVTKPFTLDHLETVVRISLLTHA
ncbi:MAG: response regulator [Candidatus Omnitrophica bacterium]|nr:response regulator [Candidatus Omnitrophota bacterium]